MPAAAVDVKSRSEVPWMCFYMGIVDNLDDHDDDVQEILRLSSRLVMLCLFNKFFFVFSDSLQIFGFMIKLRINRCISWSFSATNDYVDFCAHAFTLTSACVPRGGGREEG